VPLGTSFYYSAPFLPEEKKQSEYGLFREKKIITKKKNTEKK